MVINYKKNSEKPVHTQGFLVLDESSLSINNLLQGFFVPFREEGLFIFGYFHNPFLKISYGCPSAVYKHAGRKHIDSLKDGPSALGPPQIANKGNDQTTLPGSAGPQNHAPAGLKRYGVVLRLEEGVLLNLVKFNFRHILKDGGPNDVALSGAAARGRIYF